MGDSEANSAAFNSSTDLNLVEVRICISSLHDSKIRSKLNVPQEVNS